MIRTGLAAGLIALTTAGSACAPKTGADTDPGRTTPARTSPRPGATADTGLTGVVSEDGFKQLHALRTDGAPRLRGQMVDLAGTKAYLSLPPGKTGPFPGVLVLHEWWGLNDHIKHWADRLAADGYAALAVDLYGGKVGTTPDQAMALMKGHDPQRAMATILAGYALLGTDPRIRASRRAVMGWCFGGGYALQTALRATDLTAAVMYYGRMVTDPARLKAIRAPLLGVFANRDKSLTPTLVNQFEAALKQAGVRHRILRFDADHAFANPSNARYDTRAATAAWVQVRAFLAQHLKQ